MAIRTRKDFELDGEGQIKHTLPLTNSCVSVSDLLSLSLIFHAFYVLQPRFPFTGKHKYSITIRTTTRSLDLVAPSEALYRLWVDGLRCYLAYGEALLSEESVQTNAGDDKGKSDVKRSTEASPQ